MEEQQDLLDNFGTQLVKAHSGKRTINYIIDYFTCALVASPLILALSDFVYIVSSNVLITSLLERIVSMCIIGLMIGLIELIFKGRTLGKLITGTKAVNLDGSSIFPATAIKRGLLRAIPFEPFSALGGSGAPNPWHDRLSQTIVIELKKSTIIN